ncbi:glycosyltransferase [Haloferula sp.]|uniref:glycosyltransferase n=1 Tax=Haloferula sp. TaxID=2497595 RepID=UPI00329F3D3E
MDFTIITPNMNYGRFLGDCLKSVGEQQGVSLEHLVMDGGSSDDSEALVKANTHATWVQQSDNGMSQAINRGLDRARGDWVMWLNADDRLKPGVLLSLLEKLKSSAEDVVYGDFDFVGESGELLKHLRLPGWSPFVSIHHHCYIGSTAAFYRRKTVLELGHRLREDFHYVMDGEFYARLHAAGLSFKHVPINVADFRLHEENASMRHLGKTRDMETILKAERQHVESRSIRRAYGITLFDDPYLNGLVDGVLWVAARLWKGILKLGS